MSSSAGKRAVGIKLRLEDNSDNKVVMIYLTVMISLSVIIIGLNLLVGDTIAIAFIFSLIVLGLLVYMMLGFTFTTIVVNEEFSEIAVYTHKICDTSKEKVSWTLGKFRGARLMKIPPGDNPNCFVKLIRAFYIVLLFEDGQEYKLPKVGSILTASSKRKIVDDLNDAIQTIKKKQQELSVIGQSQSQMNQSTPAVKNQPAPGPASAQPQPVLNLSQHEKSPTVKTKKMGFPPNVQEELSKSLSMKLAGSLTGDD